MKRRFFTLILVFVVFACNLSSCAGIVEIDYKGAVNEITYVKMISNVKILTKRSGFSSGAHVSDEVFGSGSIIAKNGNDYYVITNNHVVDKGTFSKREFVISDFKGDKIVLPESFLIKCDPDCDLALLKFTSAYDYSALSISLTKPLRGTPVFAVGQPDGQINAITIGSFLSKIKAPETEGQNRLIDNDGNILDVYCHDAFTWGGSSGGMLLNFSLNLIGVNYAGATNSDGDFVCGYAIPSSVVVDFLSNTVAKDYIVIN